MHALSMVCSKNRSVALIYFIMVFLLSTACKFILVCKSFSVAWSIFMLSAKTPFLCQFYSVTSSSRRLNQRHKYLHLGKWYKETAFVFKYEIMNFTQSPQEVFSVHLCRYLRLHIHHKTSFAFLEPKKLSYFL